jgi:hypothetical protein
MENNKKILFVGERSKLSTVARKLKVSRSAVECINYNSDNFSFDAIVEEQKGKNFLQVVVDGLIKSHQPSIAGDAHKAFKVPVSYA